ncbi:hypothetical protein M3Y99_01595300 [Aphelenchoides fujianensis]|nr:hypothetical protein M3Y99_01595300 [Aphelenchoides fujianensis]
MAIEDDLPEHVYQDLDITSIPSYAWLRNVSWSPADISTAMSHVDYKVLSRVTIPEIKKYVKVTKLHQTPVLERSIAVFNSLSSWVQYMILNKTTPKERADIITKFVNVGKHLRKLANFNTLMAVIGGVTHSNISRLSKTQACLPPETRKDLNALTTLLSNSNNFAAYRRALQECNGRFHIPIMGIHLKDLIAWAGCGQNFDKTRRISERRLFQLGHLLSYFLGASRAAHNFPEPSVDLLNTLKVNVDLACSEDDVYALSLKREPRTLLNFQTTKPVVFADWAAGISVTPDPETVEKHIRAMVDAVFKHYDHDRDGFISRTEFNEIANNFLTIDSFGSIDADRQISKAEMTNHFKNLNKHSLEIRRGFKHNFLQTSFLSPSYCDHCSKLLWGLIGDGKGVEVPRLRGFIAHQNCKDVAVAECRKRNTSGGFSAWLASPRSAPLTTTVVHENGSPQPPEQNGEGRLEHRRSASKEGRPVHQQQLFPPLCLRPTAVHTSDSSEFPSTCRPKNRTVSTISSSPEPPHSAGYVRRTAPGPSQHHLVAQNSTTSTSSGGVNGVLDAVYASGNTLREPTRRTSSNPNRDNAITLATAEVFEDDSSAHSSTADLHESAPNSTRSEMPLRRHETDGQTTVR